jgi:hypothetical protein
VTGTWSDSATGDYHELRLRIPVRFDHQLVYRMERSKPYEVGPMDGVEFDFCDSLRAYWSHHGPLRRVVGAVEWARGMARILRGRMFYCVRSGDTLLHTGWATVSFCRHYKVGRGEVVIGPIWSSAEARGRGIATYATKRAINEFIARNHSVFFIDTSNSNLSCIRLIEKCEFADPVAVYLR